MAGNHGNGALPLLPVKIEFLLQRPHNLIIHEELQKGGGEGEEGRGGRKKEREGGEGRRMGRKGEGEEGRV